LEKKANIKFSGVSPKYLSIPHSKGFKNTNRKKARPIVDLCRTKHLRFKHDLRTISLSVTLNDSGKAMKNCLIFALIIIISLNKGKAEEPKINAYITMGDIFPVEVERVDENEDRKT
jgi:hypothetical protein